MSGTLLFSNKAFQPSVKEQIGFNLIHQTSSFHTVFDPKPLEVSEALAIEQLLSESAREPLSDEQRSRDVGQLQQITSEIKAIAGQGVALMGERVYRAREMLKPYKDGTFTRWLESTFGSRKTGYNMLAYFELYTALPSEELKESFKKMPQKVAYILASRSGELAQKADFIRAYYNEGVTEGTLAIRELLPLATSDKRGATDIPNRVILGAFSTMKRLQESGVALSDENRKQLALLRGVIDELLATA